MNPTPGEVRQAQRVRVEFLESSRWLLSAPTLQAMIGARVLLGEIQRQALIDLGDESGPWAMAISEQEYPDPDDDDPVADFDDPGGDAFDGVTERAGEYFEALFVTGSELYSEAVATLLRERLPGLGFRLTDDEGMRAPDDLVERASEPAGTIGLSVEVLEEAAARAADEDEPVDTTSRLVQALELSTPATLEDLARDGKLVLIHATGNGDGAVYSAFNQEEEEDLRGAFLHRNRVFLRRAIAAAVEANPPGEGDLALLRVEGSLLLALAAPDYEEAFTTSLFAALDELQADREDDFRLTLSLGAASFAPGADLLDAFAQVSANLAAAKSASAGDDVRHSAAVRS